MSYFYYTSLGNTLGSKCVVISAHKNRLQVEVVFMCSDGTTRLFLQ